MKKLIITAFITFLIHTGFSQESKESLKGTWVVESNIYTPKDQLVKFYNSRLDLIYEERIKGKKLKIEKQKVRNALNKVLEDLSTDQGEDRKDRLSYMLKSMQ